MWMSGGHNVIFTVTFTLWHLGCYIDVRGGSCWCVTNGNNFEILVNDSFHWKRHQHLKWLLLLLRLEKRNEVHFEVKSALLSQFELIIQYSDRYRLDLFFDDEYRWRTRPLSMFLWLQGRTGWFILRGELAVVHFVEMGETQALFRDFVKFSNFRKVFSSAW